MRTITTNVFTFDELTAEAKETAIENNRYFNVDYDDWASLVIDELTARLNKIGFTDAEISYRGFWSQGDGASFVTGWIDIEKVLKHYEMYEQYARVLEFVEARIIRVDHRYAHENTVTCDLHDYTESDELCELAQSLEDFIIDKAREEMHEIYRHLAAEYDHLTSDESVSESLRCNDMEFTEDGNNA